MKKRRPTALDRDIAVYINKLPFGDHRVRVELDNDLAFLKPEGGMILWIDGKRISFIPSSFDPRMKYEKHKHAARGQADDS